METIVIRLSDTGEHVHNELNKLIGNFMSSFGYPDYIAESVLSIAVMPNGDILAIVKVEYKDRQ